MYRCIQNVHTHIYAHTHPSQTSHTCSPLNTCKGSCYFMFECHFCSKQRFPVCDDPSTLSIILSSVPSSSFPGLCPSRWRSLLCQPGFLEEFSGFQESSERGQGRLKEINPRTPGVSHWKGGKIHLGVRVLGRS